MAYTTFLLPFFLSIVRFSSAGLPDGLDGVLLPRDAFPAASDLLLRNYDVIRTEVIGDEKVIYLEPHGQTLAKRAVEEKDECTDCATYTPWEYTPEDLAEIEEQANNELESALEVRSLKIMKRGPKKKLGACKTKYLGFDIGNFDLFSLPYPPNNNYRATTSKPKFIPKRKPVVFDFFPYDKPQDDLYWTLSANDHFQEERPQILNHKNKLQDNVAVSIEHVLEWNTLLEFIDCDENAKRCEHFAKWFGERIDVDTTMPVQKWNMDGTDNGVATEKAYKLKGAKGVKAIDWITMMYPGTATKSPYEHEFVSLHDDVNNRKEHLWSGKAIAGEKDLNNNALNFKSKDKGQKIPATPGKENEGLCDLARILRDVLGVYTYHNNKLIKKIMKAQADRIGAALEHAEDRLEKMGPTGGPLEKMFQKKNPPLKDSEADPGSVPVLETFKRMAEGPLKTQWEDYLTDKWTTAKQDIEDFMTQWMDELEKAKVKRSLLEGRGTGVTASPQCGSANKVDFEKRKKLLRKAFDSRTPWTNWFI